MVFVLQCTGWCLCCSMGALIVVFGLQYGSIDRCLGCSVQGGVCVAVYGC